MSNKHQYFFQKKPDKRMKAEDFEALDRFMNDTSPGRWRADFVLERKPKSQKQCAVVFALMIQQTIIQANDLAIGVDDLLVYLIDGRIPKGQMLTTDFLHELMYCICPTTDDEGRRVTLSKMDTKQASDLFERFRTIMGPLGIDIPDPDVNWRDSELRK